MANGSNYKVNVPPGTHEGVEVRRFFVDTNSPDNLRLALHGRPLNPTGWYTRIGDEGGVWMSDVAEEVDDHRPAFRAMQNTPLDARVLIHGLGLGMVLQYALRLPHVAHVDVVEIDARVIALVAPHYEKMATREGKSLNIVHADCFQHKWSAHMRWHVVWHDIFRSYSEDNLPQMEWLHRSFGHRCDWQGSWGKKKCQSIRSGVYHRQHERIMQRFYRQMGLDDAINQLKARMEQEAVAPSIAP